MTAPDRGRSGSRFSLWLREQPEIDSKQGTIITDIDYVVCNYRTGNFMILEEKMFNGKMTETQVLIYSRLDALFIPDSLYKGAWLLQFEKTDPNDSSHVSITRIRDGALRGGTIIDLIREKHRFIRFLSMAWIEKSKRA